MHGCTLYEKTWLSMHKSQQEDDFTYKTAEMIPSILNNKTINIINTSFHDYLAMYLLSGIRTFNIIRCDFVDFIDMFAGNKSVETVNSLHLIVLNINIINTTLTNFDIAYWAYGRDSIISLNTIYSKFNNGYIYQDKGTGYFSAVIEESKFINAALFSIK